MLTETPATRLRPVTDLPALAERAAELLRTPLTRLPLTADEAGHVVAQMGMIPFPAGSTVLREGEGQRADYLLLLLEGEVQVESRGHGVGDAVTISVLGPGSIIGEMSLLDGAPRSATCIAMGKVLAAGLSRKGLELLIDEQPRAAAKLLMGLAQRLADRLRALGQQLQIYAQLGGGPGGA
jgi:CRP/FNR family transcriptional regulator, cyclic AMP receptor protein